MSIEIKITLSNGLYLRNPQESKLGKKIIEHSINMIFTYGFESFNFKKIANEINSTEASLYRYFQNKHMLLLYLVNWYWEWVMYLITINTMNIIVSEQKLQIIIHSIVSASKSNSLVEYVDENKLQSIIISEGTKAYHTIGVDKENAEGFFKSYKNLVAMISKVITEVNPEFKYPNALASNLFEMSNNHIFFAQHLPKLTDVTSKVNVEKEIEVMMNYFVKKLVLSK
ncbi:MAG: AcrR family transcriptional regulator [Flavobacteriaceae bacterium]|jgi:AcrR family transcriptional regulator